MPTHNVLSATATMADPTSRPPPSETPISPAVATQTPSINTSVPAINAQPVELDGIPTSPREQQLKHREVGESRLLSLVDDGDLGVESLSASGKSAGPLGREVSRQIRHVTGQGR